MNKLYYSVKNHIGWLCQWFRWGFSERQLWSLDHTMTDFILPRLKGFRHGDGNKHTDGPSGTPLLPGYNADEIHEGAKIDALNDFTAVDKANFGLRHNVFDPLDCGFARLVVGRRNLNRAIIANGDAAVRQSALRMPESTFENHASASGSNDSRSI